MPIKCARGKPRYRVKTTRKGTKVRLAFCGDKVVEAKKTQTQKEEEEVELWVIRKESKHT